MINQLNGDGFATTYRSTIWVHLFLAQMEYATIVVDVAKITVALALEGGSWNETQYVLNAVR